MATLLNKLKSALLAALAFVTISANAQQKGKTAFNIYNEKDIDLIVKKIGNKRIVAIGEDTHGTKEYYEFRKALTQKLIKEKGFNIFILENPHEDMMALQNDLYSKPIDTLMRQHLFSIYQTQEMKSFLTWLKTYLKNKKGFTIAGSDDSYREILPTQLKNALAVYKDDYLSKLAEEFGQRQLAESPEAYYALPGKNKPASLPDDNRFGYETYILANKIDSIYRTKEKKNKQAEALIFHARSNYVFYESMVKQYNISRDSVMGDRINFYARDKKAKIIIWANNAHIAKSPVKGEIGLMGTTIANQNKDQYINIGLCTAEGGYSYISNRFINDDHIFDDTLFNEPILPADKNSWNEILSRDKMNSYLIDFSKTDSGSVAFFSEKKPLRMLGYGKQGAFNTYFTTAPYKIYDLLVFIRKTDHTTALF